MQFWLSIIFIAVTPFLGLWAFSDLLPFTTEATVHEAFCSEKRANAVCNGKETVFGKTTYKVFPDQQIVIAWDDITSLRRLENCAVRDSHNWRCRQESGSHLTLREGEFEDSLVPTTPTSQFYQVPKWYWWWLKLNANTAPNPKQK